MHNMKEYNKIMKVIEKDSDFEITKMGNGSTVKITHIPTKSTRTNHPGAKAYHPIRRWLKKFNK